MKHYGFTFHFDYPVIGIWFTHGDKPSTSYWNSIVELAKTQPLEIPNEVYARIADGKVHEPSCVQVEFRTAAEAEEWVYQSVKHEVTRMLAKDCKHESIRRTFVNVDQLIRDIRRMRSALTVNAGLYYDHFETAMNDDQWDRLAYKLVALQERYNFVLPLVGFFDEHFRDFDGSTGYHLPFRLNPFISHIQDALRMLDKYRR